MKFLHHFFKKFLFWLKSFFSKKSRKKDFVSQVIGTARFDKQDYFFILKSDGIFLVSRGVHSLVSQKIILPKMLNNNLQGFTDLDAISLKPGLYALVGTFKSDEGDNKTIYLNSNDSIHYCTESVMTNPDGSSCKLILMRNGEISMLTSINGEICYKKMSDDEDYHRTQIGPRHNSFDHAPLRIIGVTHLDRGIFVLYEAFYEFPGYQAHKIGGALLSHEDLSHIHWRAFQDEVPFWEQFTSRAESDINLRSIGTYFEESNLTVVFYDRTHGDVYTVELHQPYSRDQINLHKAHLKKYINNPILRPNFKNNWECHTVLNPAAIQIDNVTHMLYRAEGNAGLSVIGYAKSYNGITFDRLADPVYVPRMDFEGIHVPESIKKYHKKGSYKSGYNHYLEISEIETRSALQWHGVEDPRITEFDDRLYMIYAAYNGYQMARPAITSINKSDFLQGQWNWELPKPMTDTPRHHGQGNKNVVLHPEKVDGKFVLYHRIWPHICIDYVDDLDFGPGKKYLKNLKKITARGDSWDSHKIAVAAPPIRIPEGWLMIYQGAGSQDRQYKVGAMILDVDDPSRVLYRSNYPILCPSEWYENEHKFGIVYPCGAVVRDGILNIYYGGSDKYVCLAQVPLIEFIEKLKNDPYKEPKLVREKNIRELCI